MKEEKIVFSCNGLEHSQNDENPNLVRIEGYAAHFDTPNGNWEIVNRNSFDKFMQERKEKGLRPLLTFDHNSQNIIGGWDDFEIREDGLYAIGHLNTDVALVRDTVLPLMRSGDLRGLSTEGWSNFDENTIHEDGTMEIKNFFLYAISVVGFPADSAANAELKNKRNPNNKGKREININLI